MKLLDFYRNSSSTEYSLTCKYEDYVIAVVSSGQSELGAKLAVETSVKVVNSVVVNSIERKQHIDELKTQIVGQVALVGVDSLSIAVWLKEVLIILTIGNGENLLLLDGGSTIVVDESTVIDLTKTKVTACFISSGDSTKKCILFKEMMIKFYTQFKQDKLKFFRYIENDLADKISFASIVDTEKLPQQIQGYTKDIELYENSLRLDEINEKIATLTKKHEILKNIMLAKDEALANKKKEFASVREEIELLRFSSKKVSDKDMISRQFAEYIKLRDEITSKLALNEMAREQNKFDMQLATSQF